MFCDLKAQAEALILFANKFDGLLTCALRPSNTFGPGDTQLAPLLVKLAKCGWTKVVESGGKNVEVAVMTKDLTKDHGLKQLHEAEIDAMVVKFEAEKAAAEAAKEGLLKET